MEVIPLAAVPSQIVDVALGAQRCRIAVYQRSTFDMPPEFLDLYGGSTLLLAGNPALAGVAAVPGVSTDIPTYQGDATGRAAAIARQVATPQMFLDLYVNDALSLAGVPALNGVGIVQDAYLGFVGDLAFFDTQGADDPQWQGVGQDGRWFLAWLPA